MVYITVSQKIRWSDFIQHTWIKQFKYKNLKVLLVTIIQVEQDKSLMESLKR